MTMTQEGVKALHELQKEMLDFVANEGGKELRLSDLLDDWQKMLADVPAYDLDHREINNLGVILRETLEKTAPQMSESMKWSLPFAAIELLRAGMKKSN
jgi:hypothetical protein